MPAFAWKTLVIGAATAAILPAAAFAQTGATRTADDYVCAFTDDCADAAASDSVASGADATEVKVGGRTARTSSSRGFSLARPGKPAAPEPAAKPSATKRQAAAVKPRVTRPAAAVKTAANAAVATSTKPAAAATAARRVDLRLTFETGSATLTDQAMAEARVFAEALKGPALADRRFVIEGHTDSVGGRAYNLDLSRRRARAVADYLATLGVPASRLKTVGYGFDRPLDGRSARAEENRRVEAVLAS